MCKSVTNGSTSNTTLSSPFYAKSESFFPLLPYVGVGKKREEEGEIKTNDVNNKAAGNVINDNSICSTAQFKARLL